MTLADGSHNCFESLNLHFQIKKRNKRSFLCCENFNYNKVNKANIKLLLETFANDYLCSLIQLKFTQNATTNEKAVVKVKYLSGLCT